MEILCCGSILLFNDDDLRGGIAVTARSAATEGGRASRWWGARVLVLPDSRRLFTVCPLLDEVFLEPLVRDVFLDDGIETGFECVGLIGLGLLRGERDREASQCWLIGLPPDALFEVLVSRFMGGTCIFSSWC